MKTQSLLKPVLLMLFLAIVSPSFGELKDPSKATEPRSEEVVRMERRLEEIRAIDMRKLSRSEKKALRVEVRTIKKEMAAVSGGVYISVGALLLIALLLILLL